MKNPKNTPPSNHIPLQSDALDTQESFLQNNYFAEKILDLPGMLPPQSDDHDIRKITREKVEEMLYASKLQEVQVTPEHRPGPTGINPWILENKVKEEIGSRLLREYLAKSVHLAPSTFYKLYASINNLLRHIAGIHHINPLQVQDEHLLEPDIYERILKSPLRPPVNRKLVQNLLNTLNQEPIVELATPATRVTNEVHRKLQQYQLYLQQKGYSNEYTRHCVANVREMLTWLCSNIREFAGLSPLAISIFKIKNEHLLEYRSFMLKQVQTGIYSPITFSHVISSIRSFYKYLQEQHGYIPPLQRFRAIKAPRYKARELPNDEQIKSFFQVVDQYAKDPVREQIGYRLLVELGLRLSEAGRVTWGDINLEVRTIAIHSKGKRSHTLPLVGKLYHCLQQARNQQPSHELILGKRSASIVDQLYRSFKWYALIAGWPFPGGVHFFRHIFITRLTHKKVLPQTLKELARVAELDTVSLYMHLGQQNQYLTNQINLLSYDQ
ncbi:integrase/recombinase XerD [Paenibacillus sp. yr247]|uniref:tyrosine-type recombinase/integrase n=1 Tax=Paenibacillus sp. yr247 TaxID=1761880 RepID=UPI000884DFE4|nr:tyrosine-type recombinase/integrase [Paenibacillus sp. yr247]SDO87517.1 integrase/recombinase XerD [Paenibacillus sp. yr247]